MHKIIALGLVIAFCAALAASVPAEDKINVNTANAAQLQQLYRVGPKTAAKIIAEREANGPYSSLDNVASRIKGLGTVTISKWDNAECLPPQ